MKISPIGLLILLLLLLFLQLLHPLQLAANAIETQRLLSETSTRIRRSRTAPLTIQVTDVSGKPLANRTVKVEHVRHLFHFGAAYHEDLAPKPTESDIDRRHRENFLKLFNAATVTFYWASYEPERDKYRDDDLLHRITWLKQQGFSLRGHPLFWNHNPACLPLWLVNKELELADIRALMDKTLAHMSQVIFPHLDEVDVFNELVHWDFHKHPFTDLFAKQGKIAVATQYLQAFKQFNPDVRATVNDYSTQKSLYYDILKSLLSAGAPIDAIGQQSHMHFGNWPVPFLWQVIEQLSSLERPVVFTELSSLSGKQKPDLDYSKTYTDWPSDRPGEWNQANYLETFYRLVYSHPNTTGIFLWSFSDRHAWLGAPTGILHADGTPKPAFYRLERLVNRVWRTNGEYKTDGKGAISIPDAFEGEYRLTTGNISILGKHSKRSPLKAAIVVP